MSIDSAILPWEVFVIIAFLLGLFALMSMIRWVFRPPPKRFPAKRLVLILASAGFIFYAFQGIEGFKERFQRGITPGQNLAFTNDAPLVPELTTPRYALSQAELFNVTTEVVNKQKGWDIITSATDKSSMIIDIKVMFGIFHDSMSVSFVPENNGTRVDIQSRSLKGSVDLGANRRHVLQLIYALNKDLGIEDSQGLK